MEVTPLLVLAMWAAGVALGTALIARWQIVGPGFSRLAGAVVLLLGVPAALAGGGVLAWLGCAGAAVAALWAHRPTATVSGAIVAAALFAVVSGAEAWPAAAVSGGLFLGAVTVEMLLGHWYLVDPRLPRWALRSLAIIGSVATIADAVVLVVLGVFPWSGGDVAVGIGYIVLVMSSAVLMLAVVGALRESGYSGVMAATGLSYLALLTAIGAAVTGRLLLSGPVLS